MSLRITTEVEITLDEYQIEEIIDEAVESSADRVHERLDKEGMLEYLLYDDSGKVRNYIAQNQFEEMLEELKEYDEDEFQKFAQKEEIDYLPVDDIIAHTSSVLEGDDNDEDVKAIKDYFFTMFQKEIKEEAVKIMTEKMTQAIMGE